MLSASSLVSEAAAVSTADAGASSSTPSQQAGPVVLVAQLTAAGATAAGNAQYNAGTIPGGSSFATLGVQVHDATADDTITVTFDGVDVGSFTTDANGNGGLLLSSDPNAPPNAQALPANFPTGVTPGTALTLTDASGLSLAGSLTVPKSPPPAPPPPVLTGTVLTTALSETDGSAVGMVQYNQFTQNNSTVTTFIVQVQGATPDDTLDVSIGGVEVGVITTDANGNGGLFLSSDPTKPNQTALPANFPATVASGATIAVADSGDDTSLAGTLATATPPPKSGGGSQPVANGTCLTASLSDSTNASDTAVGTVQLNQATQNSVTNTFFAVQVQGATANDTLTVTIGSVVVGTFTTDSKGNGGLILSSNPQNANQQLLPATFPTSIDTGTEVTVTDTAGTTAISGSLATGKATPNHNPANPLDVLGKGTVTPLDALAEIKYINSTGGGSVSTNTSSYYVDVSGTNTVTPLDLLQIIDYLNTQVSKSSASDSSGSSAVTTSVALSGSVGSHSSGSGSAGNVLSGSGSSGNGSSGSGSSGSGSTGVGCPAPGSGSGSSGVGVSGVGSSGSGASGNPPPPPPPVQGGSGSSGSGSSGNGSSGSGSSGVGLSGPGSSGSSSSGSGSSGSGASGSPPPPPPAPLPIQGGSGSSGTGSSGSGSSGVGLSGPGSSGSGSSGSGSSGAGASGSPPPPPPAPLPIQGGSGSSGSGSSGSGSSGSGSSGVGLSGPGLSGSGSSGSGSSGAGASGSPPPPPAPLPIQGGSGSSGSGSSGVGSSGAGGSGGLTGVCPPGSGSSGTGASGTGSSGTGSSGTGSSGTGSSGTGSSGVGSSGVSVTANKQTGAPLAPSVAALDTAFASDWS